MRKRTTTLHTPIAKAGATVLFSLLILALSTQAEIPSVFSDTPLNVSTTDGSTPLGMAPGAPAGSFPLSGFESVNPYNGVLNFRLPLLHVGGRGSVQHVITVAVEHHWRVDKNKTGVGLSYVYDPNPDAWSTLDDPYCLGTMVGRRTGLSQADGGLIYCPGNGSALTRLTFTTPDGTEFEFRDAPTNGEVKDNVYAPGGPDPDNPNHCDLQAQPYSRGRVFVTGDGSAATFVSDTNIYEHSDSGDLQSLPEELSFLSGYLFLRDGTCYRIQNAKVAWIRDRNGNKISVEASTIKDSLNREANIATGLYDSVSNRYYDEITYKGFNGTTTNGVARRIRIWYRSLDECLRQPSFPPPAKSREFLFSPLDADNTPYNPRVVSEVELPDGRQYQLKYNWWGELARVDLPTGGHIEYDYDAGLAGGGQGDTGVISSSIGGDLKKHIYRRVIERRVYKDGGTTPELRDTYSRPENVSGGNDGYVEVQHIAADTTVLARERHYYFGSPKASFFKQPHEFSKWQDGKEYKTEFFEKGSIGTAGLLRTVENEWHQRPLEGWWGTNSEDVNAPPIDTRVTVVETTLNDANPAQVSKQEFAYDDYNNKTEVRDFDFGSSTPTRKSQTDYLTSGYDTVALSGNNPDPTSTIHIRDLPTEQRVRDAGGTLRAKTGYEYDNYASDSFHASLMARANITGLCTRFNSSGNCVATDPTTYLTRGNATKTTRYLLDTSGGETGSISAYAQYDVAGNVVKAIDPRSTTNNIIATTFDFDDRYGVPNDEARSNTRPSEVPSPFQTYAFATKVTSPAPFNHTVYTKYDYYLGKPVNVEDANQIVAKGSYDDLLDRGTELVTGIFTGSQLERRTKFIYDDVAKTITTQSDQTILNDDAFKTVSFYDGLGRTFESHSYETGSTYITTKQDFDGLGRVTRSYNPFRSASDETYGYTDSVYDGLGRVISVTTSDNAVVATAYDGPRVLVTDQAGKQRISKTDGLGRLTDVWEIRSADATTGTEAVTFPNYPAVQNGYRTKYKYDVLDDLAQVTQQVGTSGSTQNRYFMYDSLKRLIRARNPEQDINTNLTPAITDPVTSNTQWCMKYDYDANSSLSLKTDARNITTTYDYDKLNRVTSRVYSNDPQSTPAVNYYYDAQPLPPSKPPGFTPANSTGRLIALCYGGATSSAGTYQSYDQLGRVISSFQQTDSQNYGFTYDYNLAGQMITETYPSGRSITNAYDLAGRLISVNGHRTGEPNKAYASAISYAPQGAMSSMTLGNNLVETTEFNNRLQPTFIKLGTSGTPTSVLQLGYEYNTTGQSNNNGNVLKQTITIPGTPNVVMTQNYAYDALNRLESASENSGASWSQTYGYDRYGNRWVSNSIGYMLNSLTPTSLGDFAAATNRINLSQYDFAGNQIVDKQNRTFGYDAENRQTKFNDTVPRYFYDGDGHRVKKIDGTGTSVFVYNAGGQLIAEYHNDPVPSPAGGGGTSYLTTDQLGSTRVVTNSIGNVKARHDYLPFGEEIPSSVGSRSSVPSYGGADSTRQKFTQKERDIESGLDYFLARYYSSAQGRFTSPDEFTGGPDELFDFAQDASDNPTFYAELYEPQSLNKYQYAFNNPLRYVDPDGHQVSPRDITKALKKIAEFREKARRFLGTDRESNVRRGIESGLTREQAEASADMAEAFNDSFALGPIKGLRSARLFSGVTSRLESGLSRAIGTEVSVGSGHVTRRVIERVLTEGGSLAGVTVKQLGKTLNKGEFYKDAVTGSFIAVRKNVAIAFVVEKSKVIIKTIENAGNIKEGERFTRVARPF